jgi:hypothetical protein
VFTLEGHPEAEFVNLSRAFNAINPTNPAVDLVIDSPTSDCIGAEDEQFSDSNHEKMVACRDVCPPAKQGQGNPIYCRANCPSTFSELNK